MDGDFDDKRIVERFGQNKANRLPGGYRQQAMLVSR
jgi:hypothetical protein